MAGKEISVKKYVVRLSVEEREQLETLIRKGKGPARRLLKARILLKADVSDAGATTRSLSPWTPVLPWSTACASNWWKRGSRQF